MEELLKIAIPTRNPGAKFPIILKEIDSQMRQLVSESGNHQIASLQISINGLDGFCFEDLLEDICKDAPYSMLIKTHQENQGFDGNFLSVLEGDYRYIWIVGDDDFLAPNAISSLVGILKKENPDYVYVGGYADRRYAHFQTTDLNELVQYTDFRVGAIASNVFSKRIVDEFSQVRSYLYFKNWPQLALILNTAKEHTRYLAFSERLYEDWDEKKRWLADVGQRSVNSDLWATTNLEQYDFRTSHAALQKSIDAVLFRGIGMRVLKSLLMCRNSFDYRILFKSLLR